MLLNADKVQETKKRPIELRGFKREGEENSRPCEILK